MNDNEDIKYMTAYEEYDAPIYRMIWFKSQIHIYIYLKFMNDIIYSLSVFCLQPHGMASWWNMNLIHITVQLWKNKSGQVIWTYLWFCSLYHHTRQLHYITLQSFGRRFYPKRLTISEFNIGRQENYWSSEVLRAFSSWSSN